MRDVLSCQSSAASCSTTEEQGVKHQQAKANLVQLEGETSNSLFDTLEAWNGYLKAEKIDFSKVVQQSDFGHTAGGVSEASTRNVLPSKPKRRRQRGPSL